MTSEPSAVEQAIYDAAVKYDAYNPHQIVEVLRTALASPGCADEFVRLMTLDSYMYGGLFRAHIPSPDKKP